MLLPRFVVWMFWSGMTVIGTGVAFSQTYPNKPVRIVTYGAGGGSDFGTRLIAQWLTSGLGQQLIVDNRSLVVIAAQIVAKAPPDGYTLLFGGSTLWVGALLRDTPYDPVRDFSPITLAVTSPGILVVHPSVAAKSVKELIALAKARPGELNYASGGTGSPNHLGAELFKAMAGINLVRINFKGMGPAVTALLGGEVQLSIGSGGAVKQHVKSGRLRALAVTSAQPSALTPELPTIAASGLPGYESVSQQGMLAPAKSPMTVINRLNQEIVRVLNTADVRETFLNSGVEPVGSSPGQFAATIKSDMGRMGKVIKDAGIQAE